MLKAKVILNKKEGPGIYLLSLEAGREVVKKFLPGQFVKILIPSGLSPLFPRPFTIHGVKNKRFYILYQVKGKGTDFLSKLLPGDEVEFLGPLGNPFPVLENYVLCAGGIGIAGFPFLINWAKENNKALPRAVFYGARRGEFIVRKELLEKSGIPLYIATEDGSLGEKGFVTDLLKNYFEKLETSEKKPSVLACGPPPMFAFLLELSQKLNFKLYLVLETFLACGTGFCRGCVVPLKKGGYIHLCKDGPTFEAEKIDLLNFLKTLW